MKSTAFDMSKHAHLSPASEIAKTLRSASGYTKVYIDLIPFCGAGLAAKNRAVVLTHIIDALAESAMSLESQDMIAVLGKVPADAHCVQLTDADVMRALQMSRPTFKSALDWLKASGVLHVVKRKPGPGMYPVRMVSLVAETLEDVSYLTHRILASRA